MQEELRIKAGLLRVDEAPLRTELTTVTCIQLRPDLQLLCTAVAPSKSIGLCWFMPAVDLALISLGSKACSLNSIIILFKPPLPQPTGS